MEPTRLAVRAIMSSRRAAHLETLAGSFRSITDSRTGGPMADVNDVLAANRAAVLDLVTAAERSAATWTTPRAPEETQPIRNSRTNLTTEGGIA